MELGQADDVVFGATNSKQAMGAVGLLTGGLISRADLYRPAVLLALIPFKNAALYREETVQSIRDYPPVECTEIERLSWSM